jgi:hypothetical protein
MNATPKVKAFIHTRLCICASWLCVCADKWDIPDIASHLRPVPSTAVRDTKIRALIEQARELGARESGLAVVATTRADGSTQASVVNAGILDHPVTGEPVLAFIARGGAKKLPTLRKRPRVTTVFRSGWEWVAVEGVAELAGPDDSLDGFDSRASSDCCGASMPPQSGETKRSGPISTRR